jgi:hypothetical protein
MASLRKKTAATVMTTPTPTTSPSFASFGIVWTLSKKCAGEARLPRTRHSLCNYQRARPKKPMNKVAKQRIDGSGALPKSQKCDGLSFLCGRFLEQIRPPDGHPRPVAVMQPMESAFSTNKSPLASSFPSLSALGCGQCVTRRTGPSFCWLFSPSLLFFPFDPFTLESCFHGDQ